MKSAVTATCSPRNIGLPGRLVVLPGTSPYSGAYFLNGFNIRGSRDGELALSPSIAAIDQFKVEAEFPHAGGGHRIRHRRTSYQERKQPVPRRGFEFFRNKLLDARSFFAPVREDLKRNQFGGAVGGPVLRNRIWFHAFYEGLRETAAFSAAGYTPTAEMFAGNFAAIGQDIYDPRTLLPDSGARQPFPGNQIPESRINSVARNLLAYYRPGTSLSKVPNNVFGNPRNNIDDDQGGGRIGRGALSSRSQFFGQFFQQNAPSVQRGFIPAERPPISERGDPRDDSAFLDSEPKRS